MFSRGARGPDGGGRRTRLLAWCACGVLLTATLGASGASEAPRAELSAARAAAAVEIEARREAGASEDDPTLQALVHLDRTLAQHLAELERGDELEARRSEAREALGRPPAADLPGEAPYTPATQDDVERALGDAIEKERELGAAVAESKAALEHARDAAEAAEAERRREKESGGAALELRRTESRAAEALTALRAQQLADAEIALELEGLRLERIRAVSAWLAGRVAVGPEDVRAALEPLDQEEARTRERLDRAQLELAAAQRRWDAVAARAGAPGGPSPEEVASVRAALVSRQRAVAYLGEELERIARLREIATRRLAVLGADAPDRSALLAWLETSREAADELERDLALAHAAATVSEQDRAALLRRAEPSAFRDAHASALARRLALNEEAVASVERELAEQRRLARSLERRVGGAQLADRVDQVRRGAAAAWGYEITSSDDQSITVGKVVTALLLLAAGLVLARILAGIARRQLLPRLGYDEGASHALASLSMYALLVVIFLIALRLVGIPLTAFAVAGGALAIGVGFGSQNVVSNFISGIILLAERPIKIGDLVQVDDTYGNVERIGLRSTRVRTGENIHVIVPNSLFLESKVINWTHTDPTVRVRIAVGVVYGSPTREVERLVSRALDEHTRVLDTPAPIVLFTEFGDNALQFDAHFWLRVRNQMDRMKVESEIRFRVDDLFREAGLVIAFPQRDVHVDTASPLEVRILASETPEPT